MASMVDKIHPVSMTAGTINSNRQDPLNSHFACLGNSVKTPCLGCQSSPSKEFDHTDRLHDEQNQVFHNINSKMTQNSNESDVSDKDSSNVQQTNSSEETNAADTGNMTLREESIDNVWEDFVVQFLLGSSHIQQAAIFDLATQRPLATQGGLTISEQEMKQLVVCLQHRELAYRTGVTIGGRNFKVRLADGRNGILARTGNDGCTVCKTLTLIIIGLHDKRGNSRRCNEEVMRLGDFFCKKAL